MSDQWDWELQQNQTAYTVAELLKSSPRMNGVEITLDMHFEPTDAAEADKLEKALTTFGYSVRIATSGTFEVSIQDIPFTFEGIWTHEERATKMALSRGFQPDGWGFWEP